MSRAYPGYVLYRDNPANIPTDVGDVQDALSVQRTQVYGPTTEQVVTQFQRNHSIGQTGQVGEQTWGALFNPPPVVPAVGEASASWAKGEVGVTEEPYGSNWGDRVSEYLASVGILTPAPWCMAFVYWCCMKASEGIGVPVPIERTGSCSAQYEYARQKSLLVTSPRKGDIFLCKGGSSGHYHTGYVAEDPVGGKFSTYEGNSNYDGSSDGYAVVYRQNSRSVSSCDIIRI